MQPKEVYKKLDLNLLIKAVCHRPKMYTMNGNFREITAFIDGFVSADESISVEFEMFGEWLAIKLKLPPNWIWVAMIEKRYPNETDALEKLPELFEEFRNSKK